MDFKYLNKIDKFKIEKLFKSTFTSSEGKKEGLLIGKLSANLSKEINNEDIFCIGAFINDDLVGSIFFTKLYFPINIKVYMLAPVAVSKKYQRRGIGSSLIKFGIDEFLPTNKKFHWISNLNPANVYDQITQILLQIDGNLLLLICSPIQEADRQFGLKMMSQYQEYLNMF